MSDAVASAEQTDFLVPGTWIHMRGRDPYSFLFGVVARDSAAHASALLRDPHRRVVVLLDGAERHAERGEVVRA